MKKTFTYLFLCVFYTFSFAQWEPVNTGVNINSFYDVFCISSSNIIAVGSEGTILKSTNGGDSWTKKTSGTTAILLKVQFPTENIGYILCDNGKILKSTDGGETWIEKQTGFNNPTYFTDLSCVDENIIFTSNLKSTDGGENWILLNETQNSDKIQFLNNNTGFAGKYFWKQSDWQNPKLFKTTDSSNSWQEISGVAPFHFLNENIGFYYVGGLYKTTNGGLSFEKLNNHGDNNYSLRNIFAVNENTVWGIVYLSMLDWDGSSRGFIKISSNGNESFTEQILYDSNPDLDFQSIHFANATLGFAVGRSNNHGIIWRNGNGINQTMSTQEINYSDIQIYPNPATTEINVNLKKAVKENFTIILTDISGKILFSKEFSNKQNINIKSSEFPRGNYILSIKTDQKTFNQKIILN